MDAATVRAWGALNGWELSDRGKLPQDLKDAYNAAHPSPNGKGPADTDLAGPDTASSSAGTADDELRESTPRHVAAAAGRSRSAAGTFRQRLRGSKTGGKKRAAPKHARASTADLFGSAVRIAAKLAQPLPPLYRVVRLEAVVAGPLMDEAVKDTMADAILQPLARMAQAGQTGSALLLPPLSISAMAFHMKQTDGHPNPVVMQVCAETLRHGLMGLMKVGGEAFARQLAEDRDNEELYGGSVDAIMAWILSDPADAEAEEAIFEQMMARFAGEQPAPEPAGM